MNPILIKLLESIGQNQHSYLLTIRLLLTKYHQGPSQGLLDMNIIIVNIILSPCKMRVNTCANRY